MAELNELISGKESNVKLSIVNDEKTIIENVCAAPDIDLASIKELKKILEKIIKIEHKYGCKFAVSNENVTVDEQLIINILEDLVDKGYSRNLSIPYGNVSFLTSDKDDFSKIVHYL